MNKFRHFNEVTWRGSDWNAIHLDIA